MGHRSPPTTFFVQFFSVLIGASPTTSKIPDFRINDIDSFFFSLFFSRHYFHFELTIPSARLFMAYLWGKGGKNSDDDQRFNQKLLDFGLAYTSSLLVL